MPLRHANGNDPVAPPPTLEGNGDDVCFFNGLTDPLTSSGEEFSGWCQADDFELTADKTVVAVGIDWLDTKTGNGWDGGIMWSIHADAGGQPGGIVASGDGTPDNTDLISTHNGWDWWHTGFSLGQNVELTGNTRYWLSLHWSGDTNYVQDNVYWADSVQQNFNTGRVNEKCQNTWLISSDDNAFILYCKPKKYLWLDFDNSANVYTNTGAEADMTVSNLDAGERLAVITLVQEKLDRAVGAGKIIVCEGKGGPPFGLHSQVEMVISGGKLPKAPTNYGNVGLKGNPAFVNEQALIDELNVSGIDLVRAVAYTAAHEAGHKLGLSHNCTAGGSLMTKGDDTANQTIKDNNAQFSADEAEILTKAICTADPQPNFAGWGFGDFGANPGRYTDPHTSDGVFDDYVTVTFTFIAGSGGTEFGYMTDEDEFIPIGDDTNGANDPAFLSLYSQVGYDLAVLAGGSLYRLSDGSGSYVLSGDNPNNPNLKTGADVTFTTGIGNVVFRVDYATDRQPNGGFFDPAVSDGCTTKRYCGAAQNPNNAATVSISTCTLGGPIDVWMTGGPPGEGAYLIIGDNDGITPTPPGAVGDLCVTGGMCLGRYAKDVQAIDAAGEAHTDIFDSTSGGPDYGVPSCGGAKIGVGSTWYFQYWHRQPGQPSTFSDAICVTFL